MIFNFVQYLRNQFPTETIYANSMVLVSTQQSIPDRMVLIRETGGSENPWLRYSQPTVQILVRDKSAPAARKLTYEIFENVTSRFGLILPAITVGSDTYTAIQTLQISAIQKPFCLGADENGRIEFSTNYKIILMEGGEI